MKTRIVAILPCFYQNKGDGVNERQLINALSKRVAKVYVFALEDIKVLMRSRGIKIPRNMTIVPVPLISVPFLPTIFMFIISYILALFLLILRPILKIDVIYVRYPPIATGILSFSSLAQRTIVKIVSIIEDELRYKGLARLLAKEFFAFSDKVALLRAGAIAMISKTLYYELLKRRGVKRTGMFVEITPGVDLNLVGKILRSRRPSYVSSNRPFIVCFLGTLAWWQGVDVLVKALARLRERGVPLKFLIIGDGPMRSLIERMLKDLYIDYEITGFISHEEALKRLSTADVLVLPRRRTSTTEHVIPIKVIEAWALGIPVIITKHKIFINMGFKDGEHLLYCEPNPGNIAETILRLIHNKELRHRLSREGSKLAKMFSYDKIAEQLLKSIKVNYDHN